MNVKKGCTAALSVSMFLGAAWALPLQAASIHGDEPPIGKPADVGFQGAPGEDPFGKFVSEEAKYGGLSDIEPLREAYEWPAGKDRGDMPGGKWENSQAHLDDAKWDSHKNGLPGAIDNPGYLTNHPSAVPLPAAVWLFGSGLLGVVGLARRRSS